MNPIILENLHNITNDLREFIGNYNKLVEESKLQYTVFRLLINYTKTKKRLREIELFFSSHSKADKDKIGKKLTEYRINYYNGSKIEDINKTPPHKKPWVDWITCLEHSNNYTDEELKWGKLRDERKKLKWETGNIRQRLYNIGLKLLKQNNKEGEGITMYDIEDKILKEALETLSEIEEDVIKRRFGLNGNYETLSSIARTHNLTRERIRQIEKKALGKINKFKENNKQGYDKKITPTTKGLKVVIKKDAFTNK